MCCRLDDVCHHLAATFPFPCPSPSPPRPPPPASACLAAGWMMRGTISRSPGLWRLERCACTLTASLSRPSQSRTESEVCWGGGGGTWLLWCVVGAHGCCSVWWGYMVVAGAHGIYGVWWSISKFSFVLNSSCHHITSVCLPAPPPSCPGQPVPPPPCLPAYPPAPALPLPPGEQRSSQEGGVSPILAAGSSRAAVGSLVLGQVRGVNTLGNTITCANGASSWHLKPKLQLPQTPETYFGQ